MSNKMFYNALEKSSIVRGPDGVLHLHELVLLICTSYQTPSAWNESTNCAVLWKLIPTCTCAGLIKQSHDPSVALSSSSIMKHEMSPKLFCSLKPLISFVFVKLVSSESNCQFVLTWISESFRSKGSSKSVQDLRRLVASTAWVSRAAIIASNSSLAIPLILQLRESGVTWRKLASLLVAVISYGSIGGGSNVF